MRVLMFGWEFPPYNAGGLGVACKGLAQALSREGVDIVFVLPKAIAAEAGFPIRFAGVPNLTLHSVDTALSPYADAASYEAQIARTGSAGAYGSTIFEEARRYGELARHIARSESYDVIHAHDWLSFQAGVAAREESGKPLLLHVHISSYEQSGGSPDPRVKDVEEYGFARADGIITVSHATKRVLVEKYGVSPERIWVIHNGIDPAAYDDASVTQQPPLPARQSYHRMALFVGRLSMHKGPDYFLEAACRVVAHQPSTLFVLAGAGELERQLIRQAAGSGIGSRVIFSGFVRGAELSRLYRTADLTVMSSVTEPFGITPLEAAMHRTPTLVSKQAGVAEVLHHSLKVDFWDAEEMSNKILSAFRYPSLAKQLSDYGYQQARQLTWERAAQKCVPVYKQCLSLPSARV